MHCSNKSYREGDDVLMEGSYRGTSGWNTVDGTMPTVTFGGAATAATSVAQNAWIDVKAGGALNANTYVDVVVPIYSSLFQNEKAYPLCLMSQATNISLDLATFGKAFFVGENYYTEYVVSNAIVCYDLLQVNADYLMALKGQMAQGMLYSIPFTSVLSSQFAKQGASTTISWGVGCSSLKGVTYSVVVAPTVATNPKYLISDSSVGLAAGNNFRMMVDGSQQSSVVLDSSASRYISQQQVFGLATDVSRSVTSGGIITYGATSYAVTSQTYDNNFFVGGQACHKVAENLAMTGSQCNQLSLIIETDGVAGTVIYANAWHDRILALSADGSANIIL